jgi:hypothetical protein
MAKHLQPLTPIAPQSAITDLRPTPIAPEFLPREPCFALADTLLRINNSYVTLPAVVTYATHRHQDHLILISAPSGREIHLLTSLGPHDTEIARDFTHFRQQLDTAFTRQRQRNGSVPHRSIFARSFITTLIEVLGPAGLLDSAGQICRTLGLWSDNSESFTRWISRPRIEIRQNTRDWRELPRPVARGLLGTVAAACTEADCPSVIFEQLNHLAAEVTSTLHRYQRRC